MTVFVTSAVLAAQLGTANTADPWLTTVCDAVNSFAAAYPWLLDADDQPTPAAKAGCVLMAGRLFRRRNSLGGIETMGSEGAATYVARTDPDIARLLQLDQYATPKVG